MGYKVFKTKKATKEDLGRALQLMLENLNDMKINSSYESFEVIRVGRFLEGEAYYHEVEENAYYNCVGFEVEVEYSFNFDGKITQPEKSTGFYALWVGKSHPVAPFTFEESYREFGDIDRFTNGYGDHIDVLEVLATVDEVAEASKDLL